MFGFELPVKTSFGTVGVDTTTLSPNQGAFLKNQKIARLSSVVLTLLAAAGCSHLEVLGYDKQANTVQIKVGRWDSKDDAKEQAQKYCASHVTLTNGDAKAGADGDTVYSFSCDR